MHELYARTGYISPAGHITDASLTQRARSGLERWVSQIKPKLPKEAAFAHNHMALPWLRELAAHKSIVDAVATCLGCNSVYLYSSHLLPREAGHSLATDSGIDWHEDGYLCAPVQQLSNHSSRPPKSPLLIAASPRRADT